MAQAVLGLLDKGGGGGGADHLHLEAARELLPLIAEKELGEGEGRFYWEGRGSPPPLNTERLEPGRRQLVEG
jgi:hypothetical protein